MTNACKDSITHSNSCEEETGDKKKKSVIWVVCKRQINLLYKTNKMMTDSLGNRKIKKYEILLSCPGKKLPSFARLLSDRNSPKRYVR